MNDNIERVETILNQFELIDGAKANIFASIAWTFAVRLTNYLTALEKARDEESIRKLEKRISDTSDVLTWAMVQANKEYAPEAQAVVEMLSVPQKVSLLDVAALAEVMEVDPTEIVAVRKQEAIDQATEIADNAEHLIKKLHIHLTRTPVCDPTIDEATTLSICNKVASKAAQYMRNKLSAALRIRNPEVQLAIAAERKVLKQIKDSAEALGSHMARLLEEASPIMNEGTAQEMH